MTTTETSRDEEGMAMITAILVSVVVLFLGYVATGLSDHAFSSGRVDHKRITTFHAAEGGLDHALEMLQSTLLASLPCASPLVRSLGGGAYAPDYIVTFTYYSVYPIAGSAMTCPLSAEPAAVRLRSVGGSSDPIGSSRQVEATVRLSVPPGLNAFERAVFSDATIEFDGPVDIAGDVGDDAAIYTNGAYNCDQPQQLAGSVVVQGAATLSSGCSTNLDVTAGGAVDASGGVIIGGNVTSSTSSVSLAVSTTVFGDARAATTVTFDGTSSVSGLAIVDPDMAAPAASTFPALTYVAADWTAAGYTVVNYTDCAVARAALVAGFAGPTVMRVSGCRFDTLSTTTATLNNHVAIVAEQGFDLAASTTFRVAAAAGPRIFLIVPSGSSCVGTAGRITMGTGMTFDVPLRMFAYTPCLLTAQNAGTMLGQLYGGTVRFGALKLAFRNVGAVPGYAPPTPVVARRVVVVAKREVSA